MTNTVLIFDSGVGGLSILKEIHQQLPQLNLNYLMDNAAFPYGTKSDEFLTKRVIEVCSKAVAELAPDILVVACNTASTLALPQLRAALKIPVVGVVPAIKTAANLSTTKVIGLIATPATVCRPYTDNLVAEFAPNCEVHRLGSTELVLWAEKHINQGAIPNRQALDRKSTRLNSSHVRISYAVFCLKKKKRIDNNGALLLSQIRRGITIDSTLDIFAFYYPHLHFYGDQSSNILKNGFHSTPLSQLNT